MIMAASNEKGAFADWSARGLRASFSALVKELPALHLLILMKLGFH